jgi:thiol-disulfide isomerase/thioredoxin
MKKHILTCLLGYAANNLIKNNMKRITKKLSFLMTFLLAFCTLSLKAQTQFTINGNLTSLPPQAKVMLYRVEYGGTNHESTLIVKDSTVAKNGIFSIKGSIDEPVKATIVIKGVDAKKQKGDVQIFFLESGTTTIQGKDISTAQISGTKVQQDYLALTEQLKPLNLKLEKVESDVLEHKKDTTGVAPFERIYNVLREIESERLKFYMTHPDSWVSLQGFRVYDNPFYASHPELSVTLPQPYLWELPKDAPAYQTAFNRLSDRLKNSKDGQRIANDVRIGATVGVGLQVENFTQHTSTDQSFSLSSLRGKYVLLDFWASWCPPCRIENSELVKIYDQYSSKKFEIVSVSADNKKDAWLKAIKADGIKWTSICDLKGNRDGLVRKYNAIVLPYNLLIDPAGKIIGINLHGTELNEALAKYIQ